MASITEQFRAMLPTNVNVTSLITLTSLFIFFIVFLMIVAVITFFIVRNFFYYNKKIIIFEKIGGKWEDSRKDRAMSVRMQMTGDTTFYLKKLKRYIPTPNIQTGRNKYYFAITSDGEMINIGIEDIDKLKRQLKVHFLHGDMRYSRVALQKNLKERYASPSFWSTYGGLIAYVGLIAITGIMMWLLFDKFLDIGGSVNTAVTTANKVNEQTLQILSKLDNVCRGSGLRSA